MDQSDDRQGSNSSILLPKPQANRQSLQGFFTDSEIQPERKQNLSRSQKILSSLDIFSFIPIPQTFPVSTKISKIGSIILILLFASYVIYDLYYFITNNAPRVNSFETEIVPNHLYPVPEMAIAFIYGDPLANTLNDPRYFTINGYQINTKEDKQELPLNPCGNLTWLGELQTFYRNLSCINSSQANLSGVLYASPVAQYPRFKLNLCEGNTSKTVDCVSLQDLQDMTSGGRLFLFMKQQRNMNFATARKTTTDQYGEFQLFNYFLVPFIYGRVVITLQPVDYVIYPDYLTTWTTQRFTHMNVIGNQYQISNVSHKNQSDLFSISVLLSNQGKTVELLFSTSIDHVAMWGAFWGVLFAGFAIFFLTYNRKLFYKKKPIWNRFQEKVEEIEEQRQLLQKRITRFGEASARN